MDVNDVSWTNFENRLLFDEVINAAFMDGGPSCTVLSAWKHTVSSAMWHLYTLQGLQGHIFVSFISDLRET